MGLVFLAAIVPAILVKLSAPYWFHSVPYAPRVCAAAALMSLSYLTVAAGRSRAVQLAGVALASLQVCCVYFTLHVEHEDKLMPLLLHRGCRAGSERRPASR